MKKLEPVLVSNEIKAILSDAKKLEELKTEMKKFIDINSYEKGSVKMMNFYRKK
ncbi:MAG: hypothetical protein Q9M91_07180 [Candidatus Dojkabacteria bacterium]|nr:hypothetical protein [Candidatus Dojkabacteria bacterium]